ncbi:MFS transporter [Bacillaceae bacterium S4-13-56]
MKKQNSRYRWVVFGSVLFTYLLMSSQRTAPGLITDQLMVDFGVTASIIGLVTSVQFFVYTALQIPMGVLADRYGPNFFLIIGAILTGLGIIIYSNSTHIIVLFLARILTGIGDATIWVNMVSIMSQWLNRKEFIRLIGVAGMAGSLGFLLATLPVSTMIVWFGWRNVFLFGGVLLSLFGILLYFVLIKKPKQLFPEVFVVEKELQREKTFDLLRKVLSNRQPWALFFCHFGIVGGYIGFIGSWAVPYGIDVYRMTRTNASQLIMISLLGALIGAPLISWVSSKLENIKKPYLIFYLITILCWLAILLFNGKPPLYLLFTLFFVMGFSFGANSLTFAFVRQYFPIKESGIVTGIANTGGFLSAVLLPSVFGYILDYFHSVSGSMIDGYYNGFVTPFLFSIIGLFGLISMKEQPHGGGV